MRSVFIIISSFIFLMSTSCVTYNIHTGHKKKHKTSKKVPPGHVKKEKGSKSAKDYAPGQTKKK